MKFINFAIVKFSIFLVLGILAPHFFPFYSNSLLFVLLALLLCVTVLWLWARKKIIQTIYFGIAAYLCFFAIGYLSYQLRLPQFLPNHYANATFTDTPKWIQLKITKSLKEDRFNVKYFANVNFINGKRKQGKILLAIKKDSLIEALPVDEILLVYGSIAEIQKQQNPHQFEYSNYMKMQGVYGQLRISKEEILMNKNGSTTGMGLAQNVRAEIVNKLQKTSLHNDERAIIQALILGEKKDIDSQLYANYAAAGVVHILAVSGLHVGIIFVILTFLFKPLLLWKHGAFFRSVSIVLLLWGFAVLSGLSPSVTRAVTMFSFFAVANLLSRQTSSINTLFISFFVLLLINPFWLFQVGFQLSYLAVFFIVWLLPLSYKLGYPKNWILKKIWSIAVVSLCAQIGVMPLSLYYFHQMPGLFLLTNLVILPFLTFLMFGGILIVVLATVESLPNWLATSYNYSIETLNNFVHWIAIQEDFLFENIHFSSLKALAAYVLIIAVVLVLKKVEYRRLVSSLLALSLLISIFIYEEFKTSNDQLIVFHKSQTSMIGLQSGSDFILFKSDSTNKYADRYPIKSFITAMNIKNYSEEKLPDVFRFKDKNILIVDSLSIYPKTKNIQVVILANSPKVNLSRLIDSLRPSQIVADGSNYTSYLLRWEKTCKLKKLPFRYTAKQGAFSIE